MGVRRRRRIVPGQVPEPPVAEPLSGVLQLQRLAGNRAVGHILREVQTRRRAARATKRAEFEKTMRDRFGVGVVRAGTEADQLAEMEAATGTGEQAPRAISGWKAWEPRENSGLYAGILAGFESMARVLGGIPEVREIRFLETNYENEGGTAVQREKHGAHMGGGVLTIFHKIENTSWMLPEGASTATAKASVSSSGRAESHRRIIVHELAHGVAERFGTPGLAGAEQGFFEAFNRAAGWSGGRLMDGRTEIKGRNWNDARAQQPMSEYATDNAGEDFAESLMAYIEVPDVLRARSPARFQFFDTRKAGWAGKLRAPT
jgi:hypothetical protein